MLFGDPDQATTLAAVAEKVGVKLGENGTTEPKKAVDAAEESDDETEKKRDKKKKDKKDKKEKKEKKSKKSKKEAASDSD